MRRALPILLLSLLAAHAAPASAATVEVSAGTLRYTAAAGEVNHPIFHHRAEDELVVYDSSSGRQPVTAGAGCTQDGESTAICPRAGVTAASFYLGGSPRTAATTDSLTLTADVPVPVTATASSGANARVSYIDLRPVTASLDGIDNDGPAGRRDNLGSGIGAVFGGDGTDSLAGNDLANELDGDNGADDLSGRGGDDVITAASYNDVGADAIGLETRGADTIDCGPGTDLLYFDRNDSQVNCELLVLVRDFGYVYGGTAGADRIVAERGPARVMGGSGDDRLGATRFVGDVLLFGEEGNDRLAGNIGSDRIEGGLGDDLLVGAEGDDRLFGNRGRDRISAGPGADTIAARDAQADTISCGSGRDTVAADRRDRIGRDCERVSR
jgi:Ca2+-binding RTX toxin-like protein